MRRPIRFARCLWLVVLLALAPAAARAERDVPPADPDDVARFFRAGRMPAALAYAFGVMPAALMWLADPRITSIESHRPGRPGAWRTLKLTTRVVRIGTMLVLGNERQVRAAAAQINETHRAVRGRTRDGTAAVPAGSTYSANNPDLQAFILATLVDRLIAARETLGGRLPEDQRDAVVKELFRRLGAPLNVRQRDLFATHAELVAYLERREAKGDLGPTERVREGVDRLLRPRGPRPIKAAHHALVRRPTIGLLPDRYRAMYGLSLGARDQARFDRMVRVGHRIGRLTSGRRAAGR